jgi:hypothetical protein
LTDLPFEQRSFVVEVKVSRFRARPLLLFLVGDVFFTIDQPLQLFSGLEFLLSLELIYSLVVWVVESFEFVFALGDSACEVKRYYHKKQYGNGEPGFVRSERMQCAHEELPKLLVVAGDGQEDGKHRQSKKHH